ncbi:MAG: hypothetical protein ACOCWL_00495 [Thermoguttaceae bacterium]
MSNNPYIALSSVNAPRKTRCTRWLVYLGAGCLVLSAVCFGLTIVAMVLSFREIAASPTPPTPAQLAVGIGWAMIPSYAVLPFGLIGVVLLIAGFVLRQPNREANP